MVVAILATSALVAGCGSTVQLRNGAPIAAGGSASQLDGAAGNELSGQPGADAGATTGAAGTAASASSKSATGPRTAGSAGTATAAAAARAQNAPLEVGFLNTKTGNASAYGLNTGETYTPRQTFEALVKAINDRGGIAGHKLVAVVADTDTASSSWDVDFAAACQTFTQDHHVAAVLGYAFGFFEAFENCLAKAGVPHLSGAYTLGDITTAEQYPLLVGTSHVTADRRYVVQLKGAVDIGLLTKSSKVGLLLDDCPFDVRADKRSTQPYIRSAGINVVATSTMSCAAGATDVSAVLSQIQGAVLSFRSKGVDMVVAEGIPVIIFSASAESQGWRPTYLLTSTTGGAAIEANVPASQAANMHGSGWFPPADVDGANQPAATPGQQRCLAMLKAERIVPSQYNDFVSAYTSCDALFLYEAALTGTKGDARGPVVAAAIAALGSRYGSVSTYSGRTGFSSTHRDAPAQYRPWAWVSSCSCFRYTGQAAPLP
jgi:ABC-type branched-subunit amino acid transport system substrate-binding protein